MKIGLINMFSFRPHIQNLVFMSKLLELENHQCVFLTCDSDVDLCYNLLIKNKNKLIDCPKCIVGGIRSYSKKVKSINQYDNDKLHFEVESQWVQSSLATAYRVETPLHLLDRKIIEDEKELKKSVSRVFSATQKWIETDNIDAVICFNGRMDLTRAIIEACKSKMISFLTYESSWFGNGINLVPNNSCLSSLEWSRLNKIYQNVPLTEEQVKIASSVISQRFLKKSNLEWRQFNDSSSWNWENKYNKELKILILPSSRSEFMGEEEYNNEWCMDSTVGFGEILDELANYNNLNVIVKAHPIWGQKVYGVLGDKIEKHYENWSLQNNYTWIGSTDKIDTHSLILQSDILVINGSSAALEGGVLGKPIICISKMLYTNAGFTIDILDKNDLNHILPALNKFDKNKVIRKTLRFIYTTCRRFPQFVDGIINKSVLENNYYLTNKTNGNRIINLLKTGMIEPFDETCGTDEFFEDIYINRILKNKWEELDYLEKISAKNSREDRKEITVLRRGLLRVVNQIRNQIPKGDEI